MIIVKSADRVIDLQLQSDFRDRREKLSASFRRDLDDLRRFFRLGAYPVIHFNDGFSTWILVLVDTAAHLGKKADSLLVTVIYFLALKCRRSRLLDFAATFPQLRQR